MDTIDSGSGSFFERIDEHRYRPTPHCGGAWDPDELHFSPLGGLIVHAIDRRRAGHADAGLVLSRISFDILGRLANDVCEIAVEVLRPGRTIELLEATLSIGGRPVIRARAWLLATLDTSAVAGGGDAPLPSPDNLDSWPLSSVWPASPSRNPRTRSREVISAPSASTTAKRRYPCATSSSASRRAPE